MNQPSRIQSLPIHLANQIAAGEVIERPASVVKELVENSIDAGARHINIEIDGAGNKLIKVQDDGAGIHKDDITLALSRHATSKLSTSEQLSQINSLGFRGEALPSIASVAHLTITSKQQDSEHAWQLKPQQTEVIPASHPLGTSIEVRDLFFNLPARRRFLRSEKTEQHHILTTIQRLALSKFNVGFNCQLSQTSKLVLPVATDANTQQQRIAKVCGQAFIDSAIYIEQQYEQIKLSGWISHADAHRPQTDIQHFFINDRVIRDRVINHAIRQAYGEQIPSGRYPAFILYLTLPLDKVDVNVHPTKHEVRFRDARLIHGLITAALTDALLEATIIDKPKIKVSTNTQTTLALNEPALNYKSASLSPSKIKTDIASFEFESGQLLHQRYCIIELDSCPHLIDLQSAEQHQKQALFLASLADNQLATRPILVPINFPLSAQQINLIEQHQDILKQLGFTIYCTAASVQIKQMPSLLSQVDLSTLVVQLVSALELQTVTLEKLSQQLSVLIPLTPITDLKQAKQLVQQLENNIVDPRWCCKLDLSRLTSLFSS